MTVTLFSGYESNTNPSLFSDKKKTTNLHDTLKEKIDYLILPIIELFNKGLFDEAIELIISTRDTLQTILYKFEDQLLDDPIVGFYSIYIRSSFEMLSKTASDYKYSQDQVDKLKQRVEILDNKEKLKEYYDSFILKKQVGGLFSNIKVHCNTSIQFKPEISIYLERYEHLAKNGIFDKYLIEEIRKELQDVCSI